MAVVKIIKGDLLDLFKQGAFQLIAHGANCCNVMGAGIAGQIREQFPEAYDADTAFYERVKGLNESCARGLAGNISTVNTGYGVIANLYTQLVPGPHASYTLLQNSLENLNRWCKGRSITRVGLPLLGAGIGGLDVMAITTIINACTPDIDVVLVVWPGDTKKWHALKRFDNYRQPKKFDGFAVKLSNNLYDVKRKGEDWSQCHKDDSQVLCMTFPGCSVLTFSEEDPEIFLLSDDYSSEHENSLLI